MKNNKGFTLVELLVVIIILGIITGLSFPVINQLKQRNTDSRFETYQKALVSGAKLYIDSYEEDLFGYNTAGCAYISFEKLKDKELAKDITIDDVSCDTENTFVKVVKFQGNFIYKAYLGCGYTDEKGKIESVSLIYPQSDVPYEIDPNLCKGGDETSNISIYASPISGNLYRKNYNVRVTVQSIAGINKNAKIYYSWSHSSDPASITELTEFGFKFPNNQKSTIEAGDIITSTSEELEMPEGADGEYYLIIKAENLTDLSGEVWTSPTGNTDNIVFGPYRIDGQAPTFDEVTIKSNSEEYNSTNPTLYLNINDNHTSKKSIKMCVSVDSDSCSIDSFHENTSEVTVPQIDKYTGKKHMIYITAVDEANNKNLYKIPYQVPKGYTIIYDSAGGTNCENKIVMAGDNNTAKLGTLCTPKLNGKKFKGWYLDNKKVNENTTIDKDVIVGAKWK